MKSKLNKPIVIKIGNVQVKIYRSARKKGGKRYEQFDVADYSSGARKYLTFSDESKQAVPHAPRRSFPSRIRSPMKSTMAFKADGNS